MPDRGVGVEGSQRPLALAGGAAARDLADVMHVIRGETRLGPDPDAETAHPKGAVETLNRTIREVNGEVSVSVTPPSIGEALQVTGLHMSDGIIVIDLEGPSGVHRVTQVA